MGCDKWTVFHDLVNLDCWNLVHFLKLWDFDSFSTVQILIHSKFALETSMSCDNLDLNVSK